MLPASLLAEDLKVIGWIEQVAILPQGMTVDAKIDTGADNSSIDVRHWDIKERNGQQFVKFAPQLDDGPGEVIELPLKRIAQIKSKCPSASEERIRRPVVIMTLCLAGKKLAVPVNLAKRDAFKYRMLIGRSALGENYLVNSVQKYTHPAKCP